MKQINMNMGYQFSRKYQPKQFSIPYRTGTLSWLSTKNQELDEGTTMGFSEESMRFQIYEDF